MDTKCLGYIGSYCLKNSVRINTIGRLTQIIQSASSWSSTTIRVSTHITMSYEVNSFNYINQYPYHSLFRKLIEIF